MICSHILLASSAILTGTVTSNPGGIPLVGAKIVVNGQVAWTVTGGVYSLSVSPLGAYTVSCTKPGFTPFTSAPLNFSPGINLTLDIGLQETPNPPQAVTATLNTPAQQVALAWTPPQGEYDLVYDDGVQENFTVWSSAGNMNALKFTPAGYPVEITGGMVHIGTQTNYPSGLNSLAPFQIQVFDATGPGGSPGSPVGAPVVVNPISYGWIQFQFTQPLSISGGAFYMVMIQGGNAPNAAGLAIDETNAQFRSYSRFVAGGGPWFPAGGNFMIRALCHGPGGPVTLGDQGLSAGACQVYRLRQGEEQNSAVWVPLGSTSLTNLADTNWNNLPCGPYRWGVRAVYNGNILSSAAFSNVIGKCWTVPVGIQISVSCDSAPATGTMLSMYNQAYPDTAYQAAFDASGTLLLTGVWKGNYKLTISKFGYDTIRQTVAITNPLSLSFNLMQVRTPPANLSVDDTSLFARWDVPGYQQQIFSENWNSGGLSANQWQTLPALSNWSVSSTAGNPAPAAVFNTLPPVVNYEHSLISRPLHGAGSKVLTLQFDLMLDNFGTTTVNQLAVEIWNGFAWNTIRNFSNLEGNIPWTSQELDISSVASAGFMFRFRAYGGDSHDINYWSIDNITVTAYEPAQEQANCILGYYFYLGNAIAGYTTKNAFQIPPELIQYGQSYQACVRALYGSGYSDVICTDFTSAFLYPVRNLQGYPVENSAIVSWEKPVMSSDTSWITPPGLTGYDVFRNNMLIRQISDPDSTEINDINLEPGTYRYTIAARYDLSFYGFPGESASAVPAGPLHITIAWGYQLPFLETWSAASFSFNEWTFDPAPGNWVIETYEGNPSPCTGFRWQPPILNYDFSLVSPSFNGLPYTCSAIWLDFDLKMLDRNSTSDERLIVEVLYDGQWHKKGEFLNSGNTPWVYHHLDISPARGKGFRVRFRAVGLNSADILQWQLDNIHIYPVCYPVTNLSAQHTGDVIQLTWSPPVCHSGNSLKEGFEALVFPPPSWEKIISNAEASWKQYHLSSTFGTHAGNYSAGIEWDYYHQDEWLIARNLYIGGNLTFWSYAFQGSLHQDHYYVKISLDNGSTWEVLADLSAMPPYPSANGINDWNTPYTIDLSAYYDQTADIAWHAIDGDGNGLWYSWAIDDCYIGESDISGSWQKVGLLPSQTSQPAWIAGYNIFRNGPGEPDYKKINLAPVPDTVFFDTAFYSGEYRYYVKSLFEECELSLNSDTLIVDMITTIPEKDQNIVSVHPVPADKYITIKTLQPWVSIELFNPDGVRVRIYDSKSMPDNIFSIEDLPDGFYVLIVGFESRVEKLKLIVIHN